MLNNEVFNSIGEQEYELDDGKKVGNLENGRIEILANQAHTTATIISLVAISRLMLKCLTFVIL